MVWCCWQSVGTGGTQTGAQMGNKLCRAARHTCSIHTQTHTYRALLYHLNTQPACLSSWDNLQGHKHKFTRAHTYIQYVCVSFSSYAMHSNICIFIYLYKYLQCVPYATSYICTHIIQNLAKVFSDIIIILHFYEI